MDFRERGNTCWLAVAVAIALLLVWCVIPPLPRAFAQTACTTRNTAALLSLFSDNATPGSISPSNVRDAICSTQQTLSPGGSAAASTPTTSPFVFIAPSAGELLVSSGQITISRDNGTTFLPGGLVGHAVPVLASDQVKVIWFGTGAGSIPTVSFLPAGQ